MGWIQSKYAGDVKKQNLVRSTLLLPNVALLPAIPSPLAHSSLVAYPLHPSIIHYALPCTYIHPPNINRITLSMIFWLVDKYAHWRNGLS